MRKNKKYIFHYREAEEKKKVLSTGKKGVGKLELNDREEDCPSIAVQGGKT